ncbi:hypothetical protein Tco_0236648 [Tanacetum coccineum]
MEIVPDNEVAIDAIPLVTKPPIIVDRKIIKEGKMGYFQIIRADGSSKRYSSTIQMLQNIDREDLETLWKLVKAKHGLTRPEEGYERVLWGDLKVMFEPDVESEVRGKVYNWETATYGKIWDNKDVYDIESVETEFLAIVFNDTLTSDTLLCEPTVSSLNNDEIDFRISFDESDDEDCTIADTAYPNPMDTAFDYLDVIQSLVSAQSIRCIH